MLRSTLPDSPGKAAALARCACLTDFRWTPLCDVPTYKKDIGRTVHPAGVTVTGMPYSSVEAIDKFIGENVSFRSILSAMSNPDSALYQRDIRGLKNSWTYFGIVCNGLVRFALGIRPRVPTRRWLDIPGMRKIAEPGGYTLDQLELCDVLHVYNSSNNHVAIITDLLRDETGAVVLVEVSEAVRPSCRRACFTPEEYFEKYKQYSICRYDFIDTVPPHDPELDALLVRGVPPLPKIAVDGGDGCNYHTGEETAISTFIDGEDTVELYRGTELLERIHVLGHTKLTRMLDRGYYTARLAGSGDETHFAVCRPMISHTAADGMITVRADACDADSRIVHMDFRGEGIFSASMVKPEVLTPEEIASGIITRPIPGETVHYKVYFENQYGIWTHRMIRI